MRARHRERQAVTPVQGPLRRRHAPLRRSVLCEVVRLPCLRCGCPTVPVLPVRFVVGAAGVVSCRCSAKHYLSVARTGNMFRVRYQRYTLRYPPEFYDAGEVPPFVRLHAASPSVGEADLGVFAGPIVVQPRKRYHSRSEVEALWRASGRCHICDRKWALAQRGVRGWHLDHVIPHIGGGIDTESLSNLRVACARCNLKKGKGYTSAAIRLGLRRLVELLVRHFKNSRGDSVNGRTSGSRRPRLAALAAAPEPVR
jgi:hypothetical protein